MSSTAGLTTREVRIRAGLSPFKEWEEKVKGDWPLDADIEIGAKTGRTTKVICQALAAASKGKPVVILVPSKATFAVKSLEEALRRISAAAGLTATATGITIERIDIPKKYDYAFLDNLE